MILYNFIWQKNIKKKNKEKSKLVVLLYLQLTLNSLVQLLQVIKLQRWVQPKGNIILYDFDFQIGPFIV